MLCRLLNIKAGHEQQASDDVFLDSSWTQNVKQSGDIDTTCIDDDLAWDADSAESLTHWSV
jgi:hypothetical protein